MRENLPGTIWRLAIFLVVCTLGLIAMLAIFAELRFGKELTYKAQFSNVSGLETGNFVRIAGVEVGKVKNISIQNDGTAVVEFSADDTVVLTEGSKAVIRYQNLIGGRYLALRRWPRCHQTAQARRHHPAGPDFAGAGPGCADRRVPPVVPRAGPEPDQCVVQRVDQDVPGRGRNDRLGSWRGPLP